MSSLFFIQCNKSDETVKVEDKVLSTDLIDVYKTTKDLYSSKINLWNMKNKFQAQTRSGVDTTNSGTWEFITFKNLPDVFALIDKQDDKKTSVYYMEGETIVSQYSIVINNEDDIIKIKYTDIVTGNESFLFIGKDGNLISDAEFRSSKGQATMDCITDAYTNHGWTSVFTWVATAFVPEVAAGIAAGCAVKNL
ncbi:MAG: hypothetical protein PHO94_12450 [Petrimonas sp.]|nr:hypothetical protein [Petrimonas sp.]